MRSGIRWLMAGLAGATLALPSIALAAPAPARGNQGGGAASPNSLGETGQPGAAVARPTTGTSQQGSFQPPPPIRPGQTISVLVFPFGFNSEPDTGAKPLAPGSAVQGTPESPATGLSANQQQVSDYLTGIVKAGFLATPAYTLMTYYPQSSLVARAKKDGILTDAQTLDVISPTTGAADLDRARLITNRMGIQALLVGTMDLKASPKTNTVEITLETQLISSATGEVLRSAAVSGAAAGAEGVALQTVQERAALETAQKVLPAMGIQLVTPRPVAAPAPKGKQSKNNKPVKASNPKSQPKSKSTKADQKAAEAASKQQEREAEAARKDQKRAAEKAREAEQAAKKAAEKAQREAKRQEEKDRQQAKRTASSDGKKPSVREAAAPISTGSAVDTRPTTIPAAQTAPAPAPGVAAPSPGATAPAATPSGTAVPGSVTARADTTGYPVPYGYAVDNNIQKLPSRDRTKLRVPAWLGVAGFLTGISFLL